jgi:hypothetical protein
MLCCSRKGIGLFNIPKRKRRAKDLRMPDEAIRMHERVVWRLNSNKDWKKRILVLTKEDLLIGLEGHDFAIDKIPLVMHIF